MGPLGHNVWDVPFHHSVKARNRSRRQLLSFLSLALHRRSRLPYCGCVSMNDEAASLAASGQGTWYLALQRDVPQAPSPKPKAKGLRMCGWQSQPASLLHQKPDASDRCGETVLRTLSTLYLAAAVLFQSTLCLSQNPPFAGRVYCATLAF